MPEIKLTNVTKRWGKFYAVDNLNLEIEDNSFITLLGPCLLYTSAAKQEKAEPEPLPVSRRRFTESARTKS